MNKAPLFYGDSDRRWFLAVLEQVTADFGWFCLTYCLMDNHFHLLVQTPEPNLGAGMQQLKGRYATEFNRRYKRSGPLYDARYYSVVESTDPQLEATFSYIALNPVRAGLCQEAGGWRWSGHRALIGHAVPGPVHVEHALRYFDDRPDEARARYISTVRMWQDHRPL